MQLRETTLSSNRPGDSPSFDRLNIAYGSVKFRVNIGEPSTPECDSTASMRPEAPYGGANR